MKIEKNKRNLQSFENLQKRNWRKIQNGEKKKKTKIKTKTLHKKNTERERERENGKEKAWITQPCFQMVHSQKAFHNRRKIFIRTFENIPIFHVYLQMFWFRSWNNFVVGILPYSLDKVLSSYNFLIIFCENFCSDILAGYIIQTEIKILVDISFLLYENFEIFVYFEYQSFTFIVCHC